MSNADLTSVAGVEPGILPRQAKRLAPLRRTVRVDAAFDAGQVHVWHIDLDLLTPAAWYEMLCPDELRRAARFIHQRQHDRFLQGRACLRALLSSYSGVAPQALELSVSRHGKPCLPARYRLGFNLSHSGNLAVIAIGRQAAIGIDIERLLLPHDVRALAQLVFSEQEYRAFAALPDAELALPFLTCWTRKEAFLKALGVGFDLDPGSVHVGLAAGRLPIKDPMQARTIEVATIAANSNAVISLACGGQHGCDSLRFRHCRSIVCQETFR